MTIADTHADTPAVIVDANHEVAPHERPRPYRIFGEVVYGRVLTCTRCKTTVEVFEACQGATTPEEHDWIDPAEYVCGRCLDPEAEAITLAEGMLDG